MMKKKVLSRLVLLLLCGPAFATSKALIPLSGALFNVSNQDTELTISTTKPAWFYQFAGIQVLTPGYGIDGQALPSNNGYYLFPVSDTEPATVVLVASAGPTTEVNFNLCLNGIGATSGCEKHSFEDVNFFQSTSCGDYSFVDIETTGTFVGGGDEESYPVALESGHPINLYGTTYSELNMSTNGFISTLPNPQATFNNAPLPTSVIFGDSLFVLWADLDSSFTGQGLYYEYFDACPRESIDVTGEGCHVFQWTTEYWQRPANPTFLLEAIVYDKSGTVVYQYGPVDLSHGANSTVGAQNSSQTKFVQIEYNTPDSIPGESLFCLKH